MITGLDTALTTLRRWTEVTVATAAMLAGAATLASAQSDKPIRIGLLGSYTGVFAAYGPKTIEAPARLYLQEHGNRIGGRPVEIFVTDDQSKPNVEIEKARELIENQKVDVLIGIVNSGAGLAVRDYLDKQKIPTFITVAGARELTQSRKSDSIYRVGWANGQDEAAGAVLGRLAGLKSMAGIGADYVAAHQLLEPLMENFQRLGGKAPMTLWSPFGTADFSSYLAQLSTVTDQVDAISPMLFGADGLRFFEQYQEFGATKLLYVFGDVVEQTIFLDQVGAKALGTKAYWSYTPYLDNPENTAFRAAFLKTYKRLPGAFSFHTWASMQFLDAAVTKVNGNINDFNGMKAALESLRIHTPGGELYFDKDHAVVHNVYLTEVRKGPDGFYSQFPLGPVVTNVNQYQNLEEAQRNLTDIKSLAKN